MTEKLKETLLRATQGQGKWAGLPLHVYELFLACWKQQADSVRLREPERRFPMQDGPSIPWSMAERIYFVYADLFGTSQSLERLAERGGFGWAEIPRLRTDYRRKHGWFPDWSAILFALDQPKAGQRLTIDHPAAQQALREEAIMSTQEDQPEEEQP